MQLLLSFLNINQKKADLLAKNRNYSSFDQLKPCDDVQELQCLKVSS